MSKCAKALFLFSALQFVALVAQLMPASAQQNPFLGTWSTTQANGRITAFVDFFANGALHLSGPVTGPSGGYIFHECGTYHFNPAQSTYEVVFTSYFPILAGEPGPNNLNIPLRLQYQFPNPDLLIFSDGGRYVRQPSNPWPVPPNGCVA